MLKHKNLTLYLPTPAVIRKELLSPQQLLDLLQVPVDIPVLPADHEGDFTVHLGDLVDTVREVPRVVGSLAHQDNKTNHSDEYRQKSYPDVEGNQHSQIVMLCDVTHSNCVISLTVPGAYFLL